MTTTSHAAPTLRTPLVLTGNTFVVLWEKLGLGALPRALFVPPRGTIHAERAAATELSHLGAGTGAPIDHELVATLRLLAAPAAECYGWFMPGHDRTVSVLAASRGRHAVLAKLDGQVIELSPADADAIAQAVARELPPYPPSTAPVVLTEYSRAAFEHAAGAAVTGHGQLFVATHDRLGRRRQCPGVIEYVDTTRGRWLLRRFPASALPATPETITTQLTAALREIMP